MEETTYIVSFNGNILYLSTPQIVKAIIQIEPQQVIKRIIKYS